MCLIPVSHYLCGACMHESEHGCKGACMHACVCARSMGQAVIQATFMLKLKPQVPASLLAELTPRTPRPMTFSWVACKCVSSQSIPLKKGFICMRRFNAGTPFGFFRAQAPSSHRLWPSAHQAKNACAHVRAVPILRRI